MPTVNVPPRLSIGNALASMSHAVILVLPRGSGSRVVHATRGFALVGPSERFGFLVVVGDEGDHFGGEFVDRFEFASIQEAPCQDGGEQFDLVEPGGVGGGVVHLEPFFAVGVVEPLAGLFGCVGGAVVQHEMQGEFVWGDLVEVLEEGDELDRTVPVLGL